MGICCVTQGAQASTLWQPRGVGRGWRWEGWFRMEGICVYPWLFRLVCGRSGHNIVKQLSSSKKKILRESHIIFEEILKCMWNYKKKTHIYIKNRQFMAPPSRTNDCYHFVIYTWKCCLSLRNSTLQMKIITPLRTIPSLHSPFYLSKETTIMSFCVYSPSLFCILLRVHMCVHISQNDIQYYFTCFVYISDIILYMPF